ncbi:DUF2142 domain-containing protein [Christensenellaceae bacterium OttesenSCG-928-K19]|nr:DUF2142 domain-containing protein [Christensenellaceae bacterium OttesenSCG-928-K19]
MEDKRNGKASLPARLASIIPKEHLKLRIILIVVFAILIGGSAAMLMPRTTFYSLGPQNNKILVGEVTKDNPLTQEISVTKTGELKGLEIEFHTYERRNKAEYTIDFINSEGNVLASNVFDAHILLEDQVFSVPLPHIMVEEGQTYTVLLHSEQAQPGNALGVYINPTEGLASASVGNTQTEGTLCMALGYESWSMPMTIAAIILIIAVALAILFWGKKLHVNTVVLILIFGVLFAMITPITDTPDEQVHVASAFLMADGQFVTTSGSAAEQRLGYDVIANNHMHTLTDNTLRGVELTDETRTTSWGTGRLLIGFLPQTIGLWVGRLFHADLMGYFYLGRIFNVLAYAAFAFFAIKIAPKFKLYLSVFSLMPIAIMIAGSYNPDGMTYGLGLLAGAFFIDMYFNKSYQVSWKQILIFTLVLGLLLLNKFSLAPLCLLLFFVPVHRFCTKRTKYLGSILCFAITAIAGIFAVWWMTNSSASGSAMNLDTGSATEQGANVGEQLSFLISNPSAAVSIFSKNIINGIGRDLMQLFTLGQLSYTVYSIVAIVYFAFLAVVGFSYTRYEYNRELSIGNTRVSLLNRIMILLVIFASVLVTYLALYLTWSPVGGDAVMGVQGRYFVPLFVLLPFLGQNIYPLVQKESYERSQINIQFMAALFTAFTLLVTLQEYY